MRKRTALNFDWTYQDVCEGADIARLLLAAESDASTSVDIPHNNAEIPFHYFSDKTYYKKSLYQKRFCVKAQKDKSYCLCFEGVAHSCEVYLNNKRVGGHMGGYTAFTIDITDAVEADNLLSVLVDSGENQNLPPFGGQIDYMTFGGIYREVTLLETPKNRIRSAYARAAEKGAIELFADNTLGGRTEFCIYDGEVCVLKASEGKSAFDYQPWDIDSPKLYTVVAKNEAGDELVFQAGFRLIEAKKDGFYLNGRRVMIHGLNRHQSFPYAGYAMPKNAQYEDAKLLKKLVNCVRSSHYPQGRHFYDECDRLGLMVFCEAPGWQFVGDEEWQQRYLGAVAEMISENRHHASIIGWGVRVNESGDYDELYQKSNALAHSLDNRPTFGVRCFAGSNLLEDIYSYNDFHFNGDNTPLRDQKRVCGQGAPYLITEFNGHMFPTKPFDSEQKLTEHALRYARIINAYSGEKIMGGIGWCAFDYHTHGDFGSGDGICYHGVCDAFRNGKPAAGVYLSQKAEPYMQVLTSMNIGNFSASYIDKAVVLTNCESVEVYCGSRKIGVFYPDFEGYQNLAHPPVIIDDFYGEALKEMGFSKEKAQRLKSIGNYVASLGGTDKIDSPEEALGATAEEFALSWKLYGELIAGWGKPFAGFTFIGNHSSGVQLKVIKAAVTETALRVTASYQTLCLTDTYETAKIDIELIDQNGNILSNAFDAVTVETTGNLQVIGESVVPLMAGKRSVWVKARAAGQGAVKVKCGRHTKEITIKTI